MVVESGTRHYQYPVREFYGRADRVNATSLELRHKGHREEADGMLEVAERLRAAARALLRKGCAY